MFRSQDEPACMPRMREKKMMSESLAEALPREMARVRDDVLPAYLEIGRAGSFAVASMCAALDDAAKAMMDGDVNRMIAAYRELQGFST